LTISLIGHAAVLLWGLAAFAAKPNEAPPVESLPVEFVSAKEFSQLTAGVKNAPKPLDQPKPLADKAGDAKPVKQLASKVADKPEVTTDAAAPPQPKTEPKPQAKPEVKPEAKPAETADKPDTKAEAKPETKPETKPDQIAQELKKETAKKPPKPPKKPPEFKPDAIAAQLKRDEAKTEAKPEEKPRKFDADQVAALLDKRETTRRVAAAETLNSNPSLGAATGHAAQLSQSELDALRARLSQCWSPPAGINASTKVYVVLHVMFKPDGSVMGDPAVVEDPGSALGSALTESAKRALLLCQPFTMLKAEHYDLWKDIEVKFDPQELLGG
jgi:colicin import membrane protein